MINNRKAWNKISKSYQDRYKIGVDKIYYGPLCPSEDDLQLMGNVNGKRIIEVGSGSGQNAIYLAKKGAKVTAFDFSEEQIKYGKRLAKENKVDVDFVQGNFEGLREYFSKSCFDIALSSYALQYCMSVDSLFGTFKQINEILIPGGVFVFSFGHPIRSHGVWDEKTDKFILDNYFDRSMKEWGYDFPEHGVSSKMIGSFKIISDYINAVIKNGFILTDFLEPEPKKEEKSNQFAVKSRYIDNQNRNPFSYEHLLRVPGTLIIKAVKNCDTNEKV